MKAKSIGIITVGIMSIGLLVGFIVGALTLTKPGGFSIHWMLITWCVFGVASLILLVITGVVKSQEIQLEQIKKIEDENAAQNDENTAIPDQPATGINNSDQPAEQPAINNNTNAEQPDSANEVIGYCENCGNEIKQGDTMCMECGLPVE